MWVVALILVPATALCGMNALGRDFSQCVNGTRTAYFYWKDGCTQAVPEPVEGLNCTVVCEGGQYLDVNVATKKSKCTLCEAGTYSIGGGWRVAGSEGGWKDFNSTFSTYCYTSSYLEWETSHCSPWASDISGRFVTSGAATELDAWLESDLITFAHLVRTGTLTIRYKKGTKVFNNIRNGVFIIYINGERLHNDDSPVDNIWTTVSLPLDVGPNQIVLSYEMYNSAGCEALRATVDYIEIVGTDYSAHECSPCKSGYSNEGASSCDVCPMDSYLVSISGVNSCIMCDADKYAPAGSVGESSCVARKPCTLHDYAAFYSPCVDNTTTRTYRWLEPSICDQSAISLPAPEGNLACPFCPPGMFRQPLTSDSNETECVWCASGSALTETQIGEECHACPAGQYAEKVLNYSAFSSLPRQMNTFCLVRREACRLADGWIPVESAMSTGVLMDTGAELTLLRSIQVTDFHSAFVQFSYSLHDTAGSNSSLSLYIDDVLIDQQFLSVSNSVSPPFSLKLGSHVVKWVYKHLPSSSSASDGAYIHWIVFAGIGEGGAPECRHCPVGSISAAGASVCSACPPGTTSSKDFEKCEECQWTQYSDIAGDIEGCKLCPENTRPNDERTACIGMNITGAFQYSLSPFLPSADNPSPPLCLKSRFHHRCHLSFFGPISDNSSYFFLSVLSPSGYAHSSYSRFDNFTTGYAFGVIEKRNLPVSHVDLNMPDDVCASDFSKMVVNLGTRVKAVDTYAGGLNIAYENGAWCRDDARFESIIHFHCDKTAGDGWPKLQNISDCTYHFSWNSRLACHACQPSELKYVQGKCFEGRRYSFYEETDKCLSPGAGIVLQVESCSETKEVMHTWPMVLGGVAAGILLVVVSVLLCVCLRTKRKYERLVEYKEDPQK